MGGVQRRGRIRYGQVWAGGHRPEQQLPSKGVLGASQSKVKGLLLPGGLRGHRRWQRIHSPPAPGLVGDCLWATGYCCLVRLHGLGMHIQPHIPGYVSGLGATLHRT